MVAFAMVVRDVLRNGASQMALAQRDPPIQTLGLDGPHKALRMRIAIRRAHGRLNDVDTTCSRRGAKLGIGSSGWIRTSNPPVNRSDPENASSEMKGDQGDENQ